MAGLEAAANNAGRRAYGSPLGHGRVHDRRREATLEYIVACQA